jgi:hypothetical protein
MSDDDFAGTDEAVAGTHAEGCEWGSLGDILPGSCLFSSIDPSDLHQGAIGDCWLISAMASIAEYPEAVQTLIDDNGGGNYTVKLFHYSQGRFQNVDVNDQVPCQGGQPMFVKPTNQNEIWPCIIEKAFAKMGEGYANIDGGFPVWAFGVMKGVTDLVMYHQPEADGDYQEVLADFSGDNVHDGVNWNYGDTLSEDDMFQKMLDFNRKELLMAAGSNAGSDTDASDLGVVQGHAYSILNVVDSPGGTDARLVQLRNPWGQKEWTGEWSDGSGEWDQLDDDTKNEMGYAGPVDDGKFWMPWEAFGQQYSSIFVCRGPGGGRADPAGVQAQALQALCNACLIN